MQHQPAHPHPKWNALAGKYLMENYVGAFDINSVVKLTPSISECKQRNVLQSDAFEI